MLLTSQNITKIKHAPDLTLPQQPQLLLPERVLEFGTGVLLRGLPNYFIDKANKQGLFNGRVVVVKSTDKGGTEAFASQDGLYTICIRGIAQGKSIDQKVVNASISRVLSAGSEWAAILACAAQEDINIIISNVTEAGMKLVKEDKITDPPPTSFPGKLLAYLYARYQAFGGSLESGVVVLPTELIPDNGKVLKNMLTELAVLNACEGPFIAWLAEANDFCSTLVDRIVPGALPPTDHVQVEAQLGYEDQLMIMAEPYRLWAIETTRQKTKDLLSFAAADPGVVITKNINKYRDIKIRLLNAPHTLSCALAFHHGFNTVRQAMGNHDFKGFISDLMYNEIIPVLVGSEISEAEARTFSEQVLDRFANPFIAHEWLSISMQYTSKMAMRCVVLLQNHYKKNHTAPKCMAMGFAAYLLFMKSRLNEKGQYIGNLGGQEYLITDDKAAVLYTHWQKESMSKAVFSILNDQSLWQIDLSILPDFKKAILDAMTLLGKTDTIQEPLKR